MLLRHTMRYLPAQALAPIIQFATIIVWAHLLPPEAVGIATLAVAIQELSFSIFLMWWSHYALRYLAQYRRGEELLVFLRSESGTLIASIVAQILVLTPVCAFYFDQALSPGSLAIVVAFIATRSLNRYFGERARADARIGIYTAVQVGVPAVGLALGALLIAPMGPSADAVLLGLAVAQGLGLLLSVVMSDSFRHRPVLNMDLLASAMRFGAPVMMAALMAGIAFNAPRFVVDHQLGLAEAGMFAVSYGLGMRASSFAVMLVTAGAYPLVVRKLEAEGLDAAFAQLRRNVLLVTFVVVPSALGLIAVGPSVVNVMVPEEMRASAYLVLPLAATSGVLRYLRSHTTDQVFLLRSRTVYITGISSIDLVLAVVLCFAGIATFGLPGAAIGPLCAAAVTLVASFWISSNVFGFRLPLGAMLRIIFSGLVMMGATMLLPDTSSILLLAAQVLFGAGVYGALLFMLFPAERKQALAGLRRALPSFSPARSK